MPKRKNRLRAIEHERRQMYMLKDLEPNATPEEYRGMSNFLLDIVQEALAEVYNLEAGEPRCGPLAAAGGDGEPVSADGAGVEGRLR